MFKNVLENVNKEIIGLIENDVERVMYHHYEKDMSFPRSCGSVSMLMTYLLHLRGLSKYYNIEYIRGHYRDDNSEDIGCDELLNLNYDRTYNLKDFECSGCSCEYMVGHSWIELTSKTDKTVYIIDLTSIQFEEDFGDYQDTIINSVFDKDELMDYMSKNSDFVITKDDSRFLNYIRTEESLDSSYVYNLTDEIMKDGDDSELSLILKELDIR